MPPRAARALALGAISVLALSLASAANAPTDPAAAEKEKINQCAKDICTMILYKRSDGPDLSCELTKTWKKDDIQRNADSKKLTWGLGSAKCSVKVSAKRADIVAAVASPDGMFKLAKHHVACEVGEGNDVDRISLTLAPELKFKNGTTVSAKLHVGDIHGAFIIKGVVWTAAELEEHFGLLDDDLVREVNRFMQKECPKFVGKAK